jgi:hypothetical protein
MKTLVAGVIHVTQTSRNIHYCKPGMRTKIFVLSCMHDRYSAMVIYTVSIGILGKLTVATLVKKLYTLFGFLLY